MFVLEVDERNGFFLYFFEPPFFTNEVMFIPPSKESLYRLYFIYLLETDKGVSRMRRDITQRVSSLIVTERYSEVWEQGEGGNGTLL